MWAASIVAQRDQQSPALGSALGRATVEPLQIIPHALERVALLIDLPIRIPPHCGGGLLKIEKNPELSQPMRRDCATSRSTSILLAIDHILCTADLLDTCRIGIAPIQAGKLCFEPLQTGFDDCAWAAPKVNDSCDKRACKSAE